MLVSVIVSTLCLIALQLLLVVKVADRLSVSDGHVRSDSRDFADRSTGRFIGAA